MKLGRKLVIILIFGMYAGNLQSQEIESEFLKQEIFEKHRVVYFNLNKPITEVEFKEIYNDMYYDTLIVDIHLKDDGLVAAKIKPEVTPDYLRKYFIKRGYDFLTKEKTMELKGDMLEHFPVKKNTGNPQLDEKIFLDEFSKWKVNYPEEYEKYQKRMN